MNAKASGPLWAFTSHRGEILTPLLVSQVAQYNTPCRLIPGHGRVVPVELVEAIESAMGTYINGSEVHAAIRAAMEGAV